MRVGHVVSLFPVASETFVADALLACRQLGQEVFIWSLRPPRPEIIHPDTQSLFENLRYPIHPLMPRFWLRVGWALLRRPGVFLACLWTVTMASPPRARELARNLYALLRACQIAFEAQRAGVQGFFAHFANSPATAAWCAARLLKLPWGVEAHGFDMEAHPRLLARIARDADLCTTVSESGLRYLRECLGEELAGRFQVVRCGVDVPPTVPPKGAGFRIVSVGRLRRGKGFSSLLSALAQLRRDGVAFACRIVGEGPLREELRAQAAREGVADRVAWLGPLPRPRVLEEMAAAHVLALPLVAVPGEREGLPVVVLEAMAQGAVVVSTPLYGIPEVVRDGSTGLLVAPGDAATLAAALRRLAQDSGLRARLAASAHRVVRQQFDRASTYPELARRIAAMIPSPTNTPGNA